MFKNRIIFLFNIFSISICHHYQGGSLIAQYYGNSSLGYHTVRLTISFVWVYEKYKCDEWVIKNQQLIGPYNDYIYSRGEKKITSCEIYCEKYSQVDNWSFGRKSLVFNTSKKFIEIFNENCCWEKVNGHGLNWQLKLRMSLAEPNETPSVAVPPVGRVKLIN